MKNERGITLMSLVVTIIVMAIIAGVTTYSGMESVHETKRTVFISEMEMIQAKVNVIHEKRKNNETDKEYYDSIGTDIAYVDENTLDTVLGDIAREGFKQFSPVDLAKIELENINQTVLINFNTREVVSIDGIEIEGTMYYRLQDLPDYLSYNVEYTGTNTEAPTFTVQQTKIDDYTYRFTVKDIVYNSNVSGGTVSYKLHSATNWILNGENTTFTVEKKGTYDIKVTDKAGNEGIKEVYIEDEIYIDEFETFNYPTIGTQVNSCNDGILDVTATTSDSGICMYNITSFNPIEHRYIEIKYKTNDATKMQLYMIENPGNETYVITNNLTYDGEWHTVVFDLWNNENVKNRSNITGWRFDWAIEKATMQIDYVRVY